MAEAVAHGRALRTYQIILVLVAGWALGRLPEWLEAETAEAVRLAAALSPTAPAAASTPPAPASAPLPTPDDLAQLTAEVAASVAAQVADQTVARLMAAGWGPRGMEAPARPQRIIMETPRGWPAQQATVRIVNETPQAHGLSDRRPEPAISGRLQNPAAEPAGAAVEPGFRAALRPASDEAHAVATTGYEALRAGEIRRGVQLLQEAGAMDPSAAEASAWRADARQLTRRWSGAGYVLTRAGSGGGDPLAASPVLGAGQAGVALAYRLNPLGAQRFSVIGRASAAAAPQGGLDPRTNEAALGLRWEPSRRVPVALDVERRFALGLYSRNAWAARLSGGGQGEATIRGARLKLEGYGEGGVVEGFTQTPDLYAGGQGRAAMPLFSFGQTRIDAGAGVWGGWQRNYGDVASRLDVGPSSRIHVGPWPFYAQVDWRAKVSGNAVPGSGPVLTVAGEF